ncbi:MAG TPA: DUF87 domain-containing protein [Thermoplasmata archaeon]|nr:DUF87 domain-containing protein [Thermoplasmata archaeon]
MVRAYRVRAGILRLEPDDREAFIAGLHGAVAAAFGYGVRLGVRWRSGPLGGVELLVPGARGLAWSRRFLVPLFSPDRLTELGPEDTLRPIGPPQRESVRGPLPPLLSAGDGHHGSWTETALGGLFGLPNGITVDFELRPGAGLGPPSPAPRPPGLEAIAVPDHHRLAPLTGFERERRDRIDLAVTRVRWGLVGRLHSRLPGSLTERAADLLGAHDGVDLGGGFAFRRCGGRRRTADTVPVGDATVAALFPLPWIRIPESASGAPSNPVGPEIGRSGDGAVYRLPWTPDEGRHLVTVGETGMGKSTLLVSLARQALDRHAAVVLLDPVGDTGRELVRRLSPAQAERATWVSAAFAPRGINALSGIGTAEPGPRERIVGDLVTALRRVRLQRFPESSFWGPRIEEMVRRAVLVAARIPRGTLVEAEGLLDPAGRVPVGLAGPEAQSAAALRARVVGRPDDVEGARRLLSEITRNAVLRPMLCAAEPDWTLAGAVAPDALTVVTGDACEVGETAARYLLAVYLGLLWPEVLARAERSKVVVVLDEAQWYAHASLGEMLRLGRRFNLHAWIATQSLDAMPEEVREAALTNASDFVVFRGAPSHSRELARWTSGLTEGSFLRLGRGRAIAFLGKGERVEPLEVTVCGEPERPGNERRVLDRSRERARDEQGRSSHVESSDPPGGSAVASESSRGETEIVEVLATAASLVGSAEFRAHTATLRAVLDVKGDALRRVGALLQREGVLLATGRDWIGTVWRLSRERLAALAAKGPAPSTQAREGGAAAEIVRREGRAAVGKH